MIDQQLHPVHEVHDGFINSAYLGRRISLHNPTVEDIDIKDIAGTLSKICRWGGKCKPFFSVAQHSVLVSYLAPEELRLPALLHDASEAFLGDVKKPLKIILGPVYARLEHNFDDVIGRKFGIKVSQFLRVKPWDRRAQEIEYNYFFKNETEVLSRVFGTERTCWDELASEEIFLSTYNELTNI